MLSRYAFGLSLSVALAASSLVFPGTAMALDPVHLTWAEDVALHVLPELNVYGYNPSYVYWQGVNGAARYENRSVCNSFITIVLKQAYGWDDAFFRSWMGAASPLAATYHDEIQVQDGFTAITNVANIQVGDIIAVKYPANSSVSGHMMLVVTAPTARTATRPLVTNTLQWEVEIVDSSSSNHGTYDTRVLADGTVDTGVGIGTMRLYTDANGAFVGHTWSIQSGSTFYDMNTRHLVVGRVNQSAATQIAASNAGNSGNKKGHENKLGGYDFTLDPEL